MRCAIATLLLAAACQVQGERTSFKGWELYCRKAAPDAEPTFVLMEGTNRVKALAEVEGQDAARGLAGARELLATLAPGQTVVCRLPAEREAAIERGWFVPLSTTEVGRALQRDADRCELELMIATR